jgi:hypothetical protein
MDMKNMGTEDMVVTEDMVDMVVTMVDTTKDTAADIIIITPTKSIKSVTIIPISLSHRRQ